MASPTWNVEQSILVCDEGKEAELPKDVTVINRDSHLHKVTSVSEAVEELNSGKLKATSGLSIVHSASKKQYFLLYRSDKEDESYKVLKRVKPNPNLTLAKKKVEAVLAKLPPPALAALAEFSKKTSIEEWILAPGGVFALLLIVLLMPRSLMLELVGTAYPAYASLQVVGREAWTETPFWMTYWIIFTLLKAGPLDIILSYVPLFSYAKLLLLVWLYSPQTKGATIVFEKAVKPYVLPKLGFPAAKSDNGKTQ